MSAKPLSVNSPFASEGAFQEACCAAEAHADGGHSDRVSAAHGPNRAWRSRAGPVEGSELMRSALAGDHAAYRILLEHLRPRLGIFFSRKLRGKPSEAEDLVQETLLAIHNKRETFDCNQPFMPWAYAIARYKLFDYLRRNRHINLVSMDSAGAVFIEDASGEVEARRDAEKALELLPDRSRALLQSVKLDGLSTAEAAARHGLSQSAVKVSVHRSLRRLVALLRSRDHADQR